MCMIVMTMGFYGMMLLLVCWKKNHLLCLCGNLCCKIASENSILVFIVVYDIELHALSLNQSTSFIAKHFL